jgi:2-keto-3-deoxy-L-rhamnonate aldolase RhmA
MPLKMVTVMRRSRIIEKIRSDNVAWIFCHNYPIAMVPYHAAHAGYDGIWLEGEHHTWDRRELERVIYLHRLADIDCIVRAPTRENSLLYQILENGATGLMIPQVSTAAEAAALVRAVKFPPVGQRGLDGSGIDNDFYLSDPRAYPEAANNETVLIVQIETVEGLANAAQIAAVPGVNGMFIGPADLCLRMGVNLDLTSQPFLDAQKIVANAARAAGKFWGQPCGDESDLTRAIKAGGRFLAYGSDYRALATSIADWGNRLAAMEQEPASSDRERNK